MRARARVYVFVYVYVYFFQFFIFRIEFCFSAWVEPAAAALAARLPACRLFGHTKPVRFHAMAGAVVRVPTHYIISGMKSRSKEPVTPLNSEFLHPTDAHGKKVDCMQISCSRPPYGSVSQGATARFRFSWRYPWRRFSVLGRCRQRNKKTSPGVPRK